MIPSLRKRRQEDPEFKISLGCICSSRPTWAIGDPVSKNQTNPALLYHPEECGGAV